MACLLRRSWSMCLDEAEIWRHSEPLRAVNKGAFSTDLTAADLLTTIRAVHVFECDSQGG